MLLVEVAVVGFICKAEDSYSRILLFVRFAWLMEIARVGDRAVDENGSSCGTTPLRIQTVSFYVVSQREDETP